MKNILLILATFGLLQASGQWVTDLNFASGETFNCTRIFQVTARSGVALRSEPGTSGVRLALIEYGEALTFCWSCPHTSQRIEGKESNWCRVDYHGKKGFVFGGFLKEKDPVEIYRVNSGFAIHSPSSAIALVSRDSLCYTFPVNLQQSESFPLGTQYLITGLKNRGKLSCSIRSFILTSIGQKIAIDEQNFLYTAGALRVKNGELMIENFSIHRASKTKGGQDWEDVELIAFPFVLSENTTCSISWYGDINGDELPDLILSFRSDDHFKEGLFLSDAEKSSGQLRLASLQEWSVEEPICLE